MANRRVMTEPRSPVSRNFALGLTSGADLYKTCTILVQKGGGPHKFSDRDVIPTKIVKIGELADFQPNSTTLYQVLTKIKIGVRDFPNACSEPAYETHDSQTAQNRPPLSPLPWGEG
jgi:hypothetical protein